MPFSRASCSFGCFGGGHLLVWPSGENGQSSNSKMANRATQSCSIGHSVPDLLGPTTFPPSPLPTPPPAYFNEARGVWVRVHFPLFLPQPVPGVAPSPASTIRYLPCTAPTPRPREPRPLFDDYAECGLAWKQAGRQALQVQSLIQHAFLTLYPPTSPGLVGSWWGVSRPGSVGKEGGDGVITQLRPTGTDL